MNNNSLDVVKDRLVGAGGVVEALNEALADRDRLRSLLARAYTELNGDDMDKVREVLLAEIAQELP